MRYVYKKDPRRRPHPAFPDDTPWTPIIEVRLSHPATSSRVSKRFEAIADSGCADTLFDASIGVSLGINITAGIRGPDVFGIVKGSSTPVYFHDVDLHIDAYVIRIRAGFCALPIAGILGRRGFFEHFIVRFDPTLVPPGLEIERVGRA